jgi:hypothetical protein
MAYTPGQKLEGEEEKDEAMGGQAPAAPTISGPAVGGTASVGGTVAGSSPVAQSNASGGGAGTGFVNIDKYLSANKGASQQVKSKADSALDKDAGAFGAEAEKVSSNIDAQTKPVVDPNAVVGSVLGAGSEEQKQAAIKAAQDAINASFQGPGAVDYDIGNTEDVKRANALGNAQGAGKQIAQDNNTLATYGTGMQAIDAALYGSQQEAPALAQVRERTKSQVDTQATKAGELATKAGATAEAVKNQAEATRRAFMERAEALRGDSRSKAAAAQAADDSRRASIENENANIRARNQAAATFNVDNLPQDLVAQGMMSTVANTDQVKKATAGLTPDELERYRAIRAKHGPKFNPQMAADLARGWTPGEQLAESRYVAGSGMADASSFLDANGLSAIGAVLGDQNMANTKAGPAYQESKVEQDAGYASSTQSQNEAELRRLNSAHKRQY